MKIGMATAIAVVLVLLLYIIVLTTRSRTENYSSFQYWSYDPSYGSSSLQNPWEPHSHLFRSLEGSEVQPPYDQTADSGDPLASIHSLQTSAGMMAHP